MNSEAFMKRYLGISAWAVALLLSACSSVNTLYFDQLEAADVSFPEVVRKVGIINNMPEIIGGEEELSQTAGILEGNGKVVAETLAQEIAATHYFDEVVICDSALCNLKVSLKNHQGVKDEWQGNILSASVAGEWLDKLGVDMLLSVERVRIELKEGTVMSELMPVVDGYISSVLRMYVPERSKPIMRINKQDSIYWRPGRSLTFTKIVKESSEFAASALVSYMIPSWKEVARNYYDGGSVEMRDAGVYVREHNWEGTYLLWKKVYDTKKGKQKMRAAFNLALYHEMQGDFEQAKTYIEAASELVKPETEDAVLIRSYQVQLDAFAKKYQRLRIQMSRFDVKE